jgi:hypothetical protein
MYVHGFDQPPPPHLLHLIGGGAFHTGAFHTGGGAFHPTITSRSSFDPVDLEETVFAATEPDLPDLPLPRLCSD